MNNRITIVPLYITCFLMSIISKERKHLIIDLEYMMNINIEL